VVARYLPDGNLDPSFGTGGKVVTLIGDGSVAQAVTVQPDGKIVVAGEVVVGTNSAYGFARYLANGDLYPSFDGDGKTTVMVNATDTEQRAQAVAIAPGGKIVAAGSANDGAGVVQLNSDGSPDSGFAGDGSLNLGTGAGNDAQDVAVQADGKVVSAVASGPGVGDGFTLVRVDSHGVPDAGFGSAGTLHFPVGDGSRSPAVAIQPDGKIVGGGYAYVGTGPVEFAIARFNENGSPDMSFSGDGVELTPVASEDSAGQALVLQPNGKIVLAGAAEIDAMDDNTLAYVRYNSDGSVDSSFLGGGVVFAPLPTGWQEDFVNDAALACDGKIVIGGEASLSATTPNQFLAARVLGHPIPCPALNPPPPPGGKDKTKPHSRIRGLRRVMLASKLKRFTGTASDDSGVKKVEIALLRRAGKLKAAKARCVWLRSNRAKFKRVKPRRGKCAKPRFLRAKGTKKWAYKLLKHLPPGKYILYARATDTSGNRETSFTAKRGNRKAFRVRAG
jgi:uncharacterized delta-60 repeat protein